MVAVTGVAQMTLGTWRGVDTFANTGFGVALAGLVGTPIQGFRFFGGFVGEDANSGLYLDTYGGQHMIANVFAELAGTRTTGPTLATAASNVGSGFEITANNAETLFTGCHSNGNSHDGYYLSGTAETLTGCRATNNGAALTANRRRGVNATTGIVVISGGRYGNTGAGTTQQHGFFGADGNNMSVVGADLRSNATAAFSATASIPYITSLGNLPNTLDVGLSPAGAVLVGGGSTGDFSTAGTINVAGGLLKNDVAYTNP